MTHNWEEISVFKFRAGCSLISVTPLRAGGEHTTADSCQFKVNSTLHKIIIEIQRLPYEIKAGH